MIQRNSKSVDDYIYTGPLEQWFECLPMVQVSGVLSQVESFQRLKEMVLDASLLNTQHHKE